MKDYIEKIDHSYTTAHIKAGRRIFKAMQQLVGQRKLNGKGLEKDDKPAPPLTGDKAQAEKQKRLSPY